MKINKVFIFLFFLLLFAFLAFLSSIAGSPNLAAHFNSNGDFVNGWYWLRDSAQNHYAEWTFEDIPPGDDNLLIDITASPKNRCQLIAEMFALIPIKEKNINLEKWNL